MPARPPLIRTWLQLFRAPNLLTVPGDPLSGYLLACFFGAIEKQVWPVMAASFCFYAGGLLLNDLVDLREDRIERPDRPLPSGAISVPVVMAVMAGLFGEGLLLSWRIDRSTLATGGALLLAITAYNCFTKHLPVLGALNMGACRGLSMLLGATAVPHGDLTFSLLARGRLNHLLIAIGLTSFYIAAVTNLARHETRIEIPRSAKWLPVVVIAGGAALFLAQLNTTALICSAPLLLVALVSALQVAIHLTRNVSSPVPPEIGKLIRLLLLIQAAFCAAVGGFEGLLAAVVLLLLWPVSGLVGRRFYAS
jgi:4-hydroxybenzoate polyprenyltransferase